MALKILHSIRSRAENAQDLLLGVAGKKLTVNDVAIDTYLESVPGEVKLFYTKDILVMDEKILPNQYLYNHTSGVNVLYYGDYFVFDFLDTEHFLEYCFIVLATTFARPGKNYPGFSNVVSLREGRILNICSTGTFAFTIAGVNAHTSQVRIYDLDGTLLPLIELHRDTWDIELKDHVPIPGALQKISYCLDLVTDAPGYRPGTRHLLIEEGAPINCPDFADVLPTRYVLQLLY